MIRALIWLWQLPQNLIGLAFSGFGRFDARHGVYRVRWRIGVALGEYVVVYDHAPMVIYNHEQGHVKQSRMLGPLYLVVVGAPSLTMNLMTRAGILDPAKYYDRFPENWADRLGGVRR